MQHHDIVHCQRPNMALQMNNLELKIPSVHFSDHSDIFGWKVFYSYHTYLLLELLALA